MPEFHIIENVFTENERKDFLEKSKPFIVDSRQFSDNDETAEGFDWFGLTHASMYSIPSLRVYHEHILKLVKKNIGLDLKVVKSWVNLTDGRCKKIKWHNHDEVEYVIVYYIQIFPFFSNGTLVKGSGLVKANQNSLVLFPGYVDHSTPRSPLRFERYTLALNLNIRT